MVRRALMLLLIIGCLGDPKKPAAPDAPRMIDAAADAGPPVTVFGDMNIETGDDFHPCGTPEAASFKTGSAVTAVRSLWVYNSTSSGDGTTRLDAAIYDSDGSGEPTMIVGSGFEESATELSRNAWHKLPLATPFTPQANHVYWIAAMCPASAGSGFTPVFQWTGSDSGAGPCNATMTPCTEHGRSGLNTFDTTWQNTATFFPSTNSYYASSGQ